MGLFKAIFEKKSDNSNVTLPYNQLSESDYELLNGGKNNNLSEEQIIALFLNSFKNASPIKNNNEYPGYMTYSYNIIDPQKLHKELIEDNYFILASFMETMKSLKNNELKEIIIANEIVSKKNNKDEMINNINKQLSNQKKEEIKQKFNYYELSNKALTLINENQDIITLTERYEWRISYPLYNNYKNKMPEYLKFRDVIWQIFNERLNLASLNSEFKIVYLTYLNMAKFIEEEKKPTDSLKYYLLCLYLELNYYEVQEQIKTFTPLDAAGREYLLRCVNNDNLNMISKSLIIKIKELEDYYSDIIIKKVFDVYPLKNKFISDDDFLNFIDDIFNKSIIDDKKYVRLIRENATMIINQMMK